MRALVLALALTLAPGHALAAEPGDRGAEVKEVQTILAGFGYTVTVDGVYGTQTTKAVRSWQKSNGLLVDGIAGPVTLASLRTAIRKGNAQQATPIDPPPVPHYDQWVRLAECESGSRWDYNGSSGYDGGLQFSPSTWTAMGGGEFARYAYQASALEQMLVAERTLDESGWGAWPTCSRKLGFR
jgi:peptidoglycan hydrolase-like protein with peptidoglycan-binding domain